MICLKAHEPIGLCVCVISQLLEVFDGVFSFVFIVAHPDPFPFLCFGQEHCLDGGVGDVSVCLDCGVGAYFFF